MELRKVEMSALEKSLRTIFNEVFKAFDQF